MEMETRYQIGMKISKITVVINIVLCIGKIIAGYIGKSGAMMADGVHTLSDVISTVVVMLGLKMSKKPEDEIHPYGHEKIEPVIAKLLAGILFITALGIGYKGVNTIIVGDFTRPGNIAIMAALASIGIKEWMYWYTVNGAKKMESSALMADAWHHRSDALSSVGTLIGITGARFGFVILDPIAAIVVSIFIIKVAIDIYLHAIKQLIDTSADSETIEKIKEQIIETEGVISLDDLKTRVHANKIYVDIEIGVNSKLSVRDSHDIADQVHDNVERFSKRIKHCTVHVNPVEKY
ncbi:MAG: cation transporter [Alkaliphilus sp.]|nr:cation transporter [Alkaliphilus sp.]